MVPKYSFKGNKHKYKVLRALAGLFVLFSLACSALIISVSAGCTGVACCDSCEKHLNDTANISVNFPVLIVNKSIEPETFEQGDLIKFKIEVVNVGGASAYGLSIKDVLNENLTYVQSIYDNSSSNYLIYKFVFNVTGDGKYSCENLNKQWTSNYSQCVPTESIDFHLYGDELTWGQYGTSGGKELPEKTGYVIVFYARAKENASAGNFTNNVNVKANYDAHQYICNGPSSCSGGSCKDSTGQTCSNGNTCYCDGCVQPPGGDCSSTEIKLTDYENLNLSTKPNLNASANFTLNEKAEIYLTKEINSTKINFEVGENINFVLTLNSNLNSPNVNATLTDVEIVDSLPYGIKFLNASLCNETDRTLNLTTIPRLNKTIVDRSDVLNFFIGNMTKDTSEIKICINTKVTSDASNAYGVLKNKANVSAKNVRAYETKILKAQAEVPFYILKNADVKISKRTLTQSVIPGANATYEITLWNEGDSEATEIIVNDTLPCNFEYINNSYNIIEGSDGTDYENFTVSNIDSKNVVFKISKIYGNKIIKWTFNVSVPKNATGMCENVAKINAKDINGNNLTSYLDKSYLFIEGGTAYLQVNKEILNNRLFAVGDIVQYKITVRNSGSVQSVNDVILKDFLPLGMKFVNTTIPDCNTSNISEQTGGEILICTLGNISPGETKIYYLNARIMESRPALSNKVEVNGNSTNGEQWFKDSVVAYIGKPVLKIKKKQSSNNVKPGDVVTYTLNISNIGNAPAYNVTVKDTLPLNWGPSGYEFYTITCSDGDNISGYVTEVGFFGQKIKTLHFDKKNPMNPGVSCKITYKIKIPPNTKTGIYTNNAEVSGNDKTNNTMIEKDKSTTYVKGDAGMFVSVKANTTYVKKGENVKFSIRIENLGDVQLENITVTDILPPGFENLTPAIINVSKIEVGGVKDESNGLFVIARVVNDTNGSVGGAHVNKVYVEGTSYGGIIMKAESYATVYITSTPLSLVGDVDETTLFTNSDAKLRFIIINPSMFDTQDIYLNVTLIPGLRYNKNSTMLNGVPLTDDENNGVVKNDGSVIEWKNLSVYSKSIAVLTFSVHVENYTYGRINASISYNQHNEIGTASTFIDIDKNFVSKPFIYLLQEKDAVNINEPVTYKLIIDDTFNKLKGNTSVKFNFEGLKILDEKSINENLTDILNNNSLIEIKFSALPDPKLSSKLMVNAEILNINGNETQILNISKITELLIPPEGILTNVTLKNSNISVNLKNEKMNYTLHLKQGWNLIGLPIIPESTKLEEILKPIEGKYTDVFTYDNKWNYKSKYMNKWFGDLAQMEVGRGYWIKVDEDVNLTLDGYEVKNFSLSLNQGWNLISIPSVESMEINKIDNYTDIFTYEDKWIYRSRYMNKWFGSLNETEGGKGYWIKVENNKILTKAE